MDQAKLAKELKICSFFQGKLQESLHKRWLNIQFRFGLTHESFQTLVSDRM